MYIDIINIINIINNIINNMNKETLLVELNKLFIDDMSEIIVNYVIFKPKTNEELYISR